MVGRIIVSFFEDIFTFYENKIMALSLKMLPTFGKSACFDSMFCGG